MPSSQLNQPQTNNITPDKARRSKRLCPGDVTNKLDTAEKSISTQKQRAEAKAVKSILKTKNTTNKDEEEPSTPCRTIFLADLHIAMHATYCELSFEVQGSSKPAQAVQILLIRIFDKVQQFDLQF